MDEPGQQDDHAKGQFDVIYRKKKVGNYLLGKIIGEGSFSKVRQGLHIIAREKVAVKIVSKKAVLLRDFVKRSVRREAVILQRLEHPNIIRLYEIMETENSYYLVMENAESGEFIKYLSDKKTLDETECQKYIRQMASALDHMHMSNIAHRDLKLENLLLDRDHNIKIIDLGLSNVFYGDTSLNTQCGSPVYAAPEIFCNKKYGPAVDIWSMGVCMYAMLTGRLPFIADPPSNLTLLHTLILKGPHIPHTLSEDCKTLLSRMLTVEVFLRIKLDEVLSHPWLLENHDTPLITRQPAIGKVYPQIPKTSIVNYMTTVFNFLEDDVFYSVIERKMNAVAATYHLLQKRFDAGLNLVGFSLNGNPLKAHGTILPNTRKNIDVSQNWTNRVELPALNQEHTSVSESASMASRSTYRSYLQLLKDSKIRSAQNIRSSNSLNRQKELTLRRHKTRSDIAKHTKTKEETGFMPDFILTYTQNDHFSQSKKIEKFEWEQTFIISKSGPKQNESADGFRHGYSHSKESEKKADDCDGRRSADIENELHAPPTTPATLFIAPRNNSASTSGKRENDDKVENCESDDARSISVGDPCNEESWCTFNKQRSKLARGVTLVKKNKNISYQYGIPFTKPKTLIPREARSYFEEIENTKVIGQGRRLVERSKTTVGKIEELHSIWSRKTKTASSQREFPDLVHSASTVGRPPTQELAYRTVDANGVLQFPNVVQQPQLFDARPPSPPKQTVVDGVTDIIKVQITSSAKY